MILFPCDPMITRRVDSHFEPEAKAAKALGLEVGLIDYEALDVGAIGSAIASIKDKEGSPKKAMIRGWMMSSDTYNALFYTLYQKNIELITDPVGYDQALFPNWYHEFKILTPRSIILPNKSLDGLEDALCNIDSISAVVRDWSKSVKHKWQDAMFIPDTSDFAHARKVCENMISFRGPSYTGGVVLREYVELTGIQARTWWFDGVWQATTSHPDSPGKKSDSVPLNLCSVAAYNLKSPFITIDLAERVDGDWTVMEVGDGQVSDRPDNADPKVFMRAMIRGANLSIA